MKTSPFTNRLEAEPRHGLIRGNTLGRPSPNFVVFRQHLIEAVGQTLGGTSLGRVLQQTLRQIVVLVREARIEVELPLQVPDPLADFQ